MGRRNLPIFYLSLWIGALGRRTASVMLATGAVFAPMAAMRRSPVWRGTSTIGACLWSRFSRDTLPRRGKNHRCQSQQQYTDHLLHLDGPLTPRHDKRSASTRQLRCAPHARLAGRRDTASRLKCSQLKGQFGARQNLFIDFENSQLRAAGPDERICFWDLPSEKGAVAGYIFSGETQDFPLTVSTILSHASAEPRSISRNRAAMRSALGAVLQPLLGL